MSFVIFVVPSGIPANMTTLIKCMIRRIMVKKNTAKSDFILSKIY